MKKEDGRGCDVLKKCIFLGLEMHMCLDVKIILKRSLVQCAQSMSLQQLLMVKWKFIQSFLETTMQEIEDMISLEY